MKSKIICKLIDALIPDEGTIKDIVDGVDIFKVITSQEHMKQCYEKGIVFILQGKKEINHEGKMLTYDHHNYLILSLPSPVEYKVAASRENPVLGMRIDTNQKLINEIIFEAGSSLQYKKEVKPGIYTETLTDQLMDSLGRLLHCSQDPQDNRILAPLYLKEVLYHVLKSPHGCALNSISYSNDTLGKISQMVEEIYANYQEKYDIDTLSKLANMSTSSFHSNFKAITGLPPMQYIKKVKLLKARELLSYQDITAKAAAYEVGYESLSQFNREYKRMFGATPKSKDIR